MEQFNELMEDIAINNANPVIKKERFITFFENNMEYSTTFTIENFIKSRGSSRFDTISGKDKDGTTITQKISNCAPVRTAPKGGRRKKKQRTRRRAKYKKHPKNKLKSYTRKKKRR